MDAFVNLQILAPRKDFSAPGKGAGKGFLARMHPNVIDQLVLGLKGSAFPTAVFPKAGMVRHFGSTHMFHRNMRHNFV